jgi:putative Holliday junction resolvase
VSAGPSGPGAKVLAVDLGGRRIGLAVSDAGGTIAFPWGKVERSEDPMADRQAIASVVEEVAAGTVVVGLPLSLDGRHGPAARAALDEARQLALVLGERGVRVETFDERLTTVSAEAALAQAGKRGRVRRQSVDSAAAAVLLQAWLDGR